MAEFSIMEVIEMAVQTEKRGSSFYTEMAKKFQADQSVNELFDKLAARELVHEKRFQELKEITGETEPDNWEEVSKYMRAMVESAFFIGKGKATAHMQSIEDYRQAVGFALAFEKETLLYFYTIRDVVKEKDIVDEIINEEQSHIMWLSAFRT
jgi:rubrerythrin